MNFERRPGRLPLVGGALALNFCNTTSGLDDDQCLEHLVEFGDLLLWAAHAGAVGADEAARLRAHAERDPASAAAALDGALALRRTLYGLFRAIARREPVPAPALAALNAALAPSHRHQSLVHGEAGFAWRYPAIDATLDGPMGPIVRSAAGILLTEPLERLKQCPGHACGWLFLDRSKNNIRVWCEMEVCGARAKLRARAERRRKD